MEGIEAIQRAAADAPTAGDPIAAKANPKPLREIIAMIRMGRQCSLGCKIRPSLSI
jgi:hypothetical protein